MDPTIQAPVLTSGGPMQVDYIHANGQGGLQARGSVAQRLLQSNFSISSLRTNDVLRFRDWQLLDRTVLEVARMRLVAVADLFRNGLVYPLPNALGVTQVQWERVGDMGPAEINMSGVAEGINDRAVFDMASIPIPIVHKDFNLNIRALEASRRNGHPLDTLQAEMSAKIVAEKVESTLFLGGPTYGTAGTIYGYTNAPNAITGALGTAWATITGAQLLGKIQDFLNLFYAKKMYGPFVIYIPLTAFTRLSDDFKANGDKTILQRLKEIPGIQDIKPTENLTTTSGAVGMLFVQMTRDVVDMIDGFPPTVVAWETMGGMVFNFKVMTIMVPRMKSTYTLQSGIGVFTNP